MGLEIISEIQNCRLELRAAVDKMERLGVEHVDADREYRKLRAKHTLLLKSDGVAVGMMDKILDGIEDVADARRDRDIKEAYRDANKEKINALKLELRVLHDQYQEEYRFTKHE